MAEQEGPEHETPADQPEEETKVPIEKPKKIKPALTPAKTEEMAKHRAEKALTKAREDLKTSQEELEQERQARKKAEQEKVEAEEALTKAREDLKTSQEELERERQPRAKFEKVLAEAKKPMAAEAKLAIPQELPPTIVGAPTQEPSRPAYRLTVSDVRVFRMGAPGVMTLTLSPDEPFLVQARFKLQGPEAPSLTAQKSSYEMKVYAKEVTSGTSRLLDTHSANLVKNLLEYTPIIQALGLPIGLYCLTTLVTLHTKETLRRGFSYVGTRDVAKMAGYNEGPIVQVAGVQPPVHPAAPV